MTHVGIARRDGNPILPVRNPLVSFCGGRKPHVGGAMAAVCVGVDSDGFGGVVVFHGLGFRLAVGVASGN